MNYKETNIYPAIDMRMGMVVRLLRGDYDKMTVYNDSPEVMAYTFGDSGAKYVHLVDLDGARSGESEYQTVREIIKKISAAGLKVEIGGGIRSEERIRDYLRAGAERVILGTVAIREPEFTASMIEKYGHGIAVGIDIKDGVAAVNGWEELSELEMDEAFVRICEMGAETIICTDVSKDGAMNGIDYSLYQYLVEKYTGKYGSGIIASGGVTGMADIEKLAPLGLEGIIIGRALYDGKIILSDAIATCERLRKKENDY